MDLNKLNYIIVIAEEKSFSKATKKLFISQPALSQYLSTIENELNMKIFDRNKYPIKLTMAGEIFIKNAKKLEKLLEKEDIDIAIMSLPFINKNLSFKEFYNEETYIITPKTEYYSNLSENGKISLEKLKDEQFILPSKKIKARKKIEQLFYNNHIFTQIFN